MKTIVEVDNRQYVRDVVVYDSETCEPLVVTDSTPLLYLQRRGFKKIRTEEVPETWEELKELCEDLEYYYDYDINTLTDIIWVKSLSFNKTGIIGDSNSSMVAENRTPAQMWQIIKSLVGEE